MELFRVSVGPLDGPVSAMEMFETREECDGFLSRLIDSGELDLLPYDVIAVTREEMFRGQWVMVNKRMVLKEAKE